MKSNWIGPFPHDSYTLNADLIYWYDHNQLEDRFYNVIYLDFKDASCENHSCVWFDV